MKQPRKLVIIYFASLLIVLAINVLGNYRYYSSGGSWHFSVFFCIAFTTVCWACFMVLNYFVFRRITWSDRPTFRILTGALIFAIAGAAMMVAAKFAISQVWHFTPGPWDYVGDSTYSALISMIVGLIITGQQSLLHLKKSIEDNEQMKQEMIQSQYQALKSQVNPHFLFNSLNTLTVMIPVQPAIAVQFVEELSKVFRYSLQHSSENTIEVGTEMKIVRSYLFLNEQRYEGKLVVKINIEEPALKRKVITQSLLMLVENAIKHNEISNENPLTIAIFNEGNYLVVSNTLQRKKLVELSTKVGLDNIRKRYLLASPNPVVVEETDRLFTVKIPLLDL